MASRHRRATFLVGGSTAVLLPLLLVLPIGSANADSSFDAFAKATGVQASVANRSLPLGVVLEANAPFSSSRLNSLQQSDATASSLYPGDVVSGLPGVSGALLSLPTPAYPVITSTGYGDEPKDQNLPGLSMHAESGTSHSFARAILGNDTSGSVSQSRTEILQDGTVRAVAQTEGNGLVLGTSVLRLSGYSSSVSTSADSFSGELTRSSTLSIGRISVPGLSMPIPCTTPAQIPLLSPIPGTPQPPPLDLPPTPIPAPFGCSNLAAPDIGFKNGHFVVTLPVPGAAMEVPVTPDAVFKAFADAGVTVKYNPAQQLTNGIQGDGFSFSTVLPSFPDNPYFSGPTPVTFTVGQGIALVDLKPALTAGSAGPTDGSDAGSGLAAGPSVGGGAAGVDGVTGLPGVDAAGVDTAGVDTAGAGAVPGAAPIVNLTPGGGGGAQMTAANSAFFGSSPDVGGIYLALVATAGIAFAAVSAVRMLGVRFLWSS